MRALMCAAAMTCVLSGAAQAVTFALVNPVVVTAAPGSSARAPRFSIEVSQAAVERGSFTYFVRGGFGFSAAQGTLPTGDVADFGGLTFLLDRVDPRSSELHGQFNARMTFAADGTVTSSTFNLLGVNDDLAFSGPGTAFGGTYGGDNTGRCSATDDPCRLIGQLVQVPEPATMAILAMGLLGVAVTRRHGRHHSPR